MEVYGHITSLKISLNGDHSSRGFGYITFMDGSDARKAVAKGCHMDPDKLEALPYKADRKKAVVEEDVKQEDEENQSN